MHRNLEVIPWQLTTTKKEWSPLCKSLKVLPLFYVPEIQKKGSEDCTLTWWSCSDAHPEHLNDVKLPGTSPFMICLKSRQTKGQTKISKSKNTWGKKGDSCSLLQTGLLREVIQLQSAKLKTVTMPFDDIFFYTGKRCNSQKLCPERSSETVVLEEWI